MQARADQTTQNAAERTNNFHVTLRPRSDRRVSYIAFEILRFAQNYMRFNLRNHLSLFEMISNICMCNQNAIDRRTQDAASVTFGFARVRLGGAGPIDASQRMTAAGFYHSVTILPGVEPGPQPDVKRNINWKWSGRFFDESGINNYHKGQRSKVEGQDVCIRVNQHRNFTRRQRSR